MLRTLQVLLDKDVIGYIAEEPHRSSFWFTRDYLGLTPRKRPVLGQLFEDDLSRTRWRSKRRLHAFFENLVPESPALRKLLAQTHGVEQDDDIGLLAALGRDLPGAVRIVDADSQNGAPEDVREEENQTPDHDDLGLRFSLAGMQLKFSMIRFADRLTLPAHGESGDWIVKITTPEWPGTAENEFSTMTWAREAGFDVPVCDVLPAYAVRGVPAEYIASVPSVFVVRRFDRGDGATRIHQEDLAQVQGRPPHNREDGTYQDIGRFALLAMGEDAHDEFIRRLVFILASGNADAHMKNWSLLYPDRVTPRWTPLYDQLATVAWADHSKKLALKLCGRRELASISRETLEVYSNKVGVDWDHVSQLVDETLEKLAATWASIGEELPLISEHRSRLEEYWRSNVLLRPLT